MPSGRMITLMLGTDSYCPWLAIKLLLIGNTLLVLSPLSCRNGQKSKLVRKEYMWPAEAAHQVISFQDSSDNAGNLRPPFSFNCFSCPAAGLEYPERRASPHSSQDISSPALLSIAYPSPSLWLPCPSELDPCPPILRPTVF